MRPSIRLCCGPVNFSVPVYQAREGAGYVLISVGLGPFTHTRRGPSPQKAQSALLDHLRQQAREAKNIQDIRTFMASVGYVASQVQGREGASGDPARCSLSVTAQPLPSCATCARPPAIQRRVGLGGTCSSPKIFSRIPNADLARAIGGTPGQPLPHLSCRTPPSSGTTPAQVDEIPLRMLSSAQQEELRKDLEFYATNQTTCSGM